MDLPARNPGVRAMCRILLTVVLVFGWSAALRGQEKPQPAASGNQKSPEDAIKENANDPEAIRAYVMKIVIDALNGKQPPERLDKLTEFLDQLPANTPAGKSAVRQWKQQ